MTQPGGVTVVDEPLKVCSVAIGALLGSRICGRRAGQVSSRPLSAQSVRGNNRDFLGTSSVPETVQGKIGNPKIGNKRRSAACN